jgi:Transposase DDE domain
MNSPWPDGILVLKLFVLLFSNQWVSQWKKQWARQQALFSPSQDEPSPRKGQGKKKQKQEPHRSKPMSFYERNFTLRITLWYLLYQRLSFDVTLAGVVRNARNGGADRLGPRGKAKLSKRIRSAHTSSYNEARQRLPLALVQAALAYIAEKIQVLVGWSQAGNEKPDPLWRSRRLLDGSTLAVLSTSKLNEEYPAAKVRSRTSDWCLMRIVVAFCARSGAVLSAIEAATKQSEQRLAWQIMAEAGRWVIWVGDRNFGIWSVLAQAIRHHQDVLVRLTHLRAKKLRGKRKLRSGEERVICWSRSPHDQAAPGSEEVVVEGRLIYVRLHRGHSVIDLWLFTTLKAEECSLELLVKWYGQRWQAEVHFRSVKTHMHLSKLDVESPEMARKEFYAAVVAYSLVRAVMWGAGENLENGAQTLSFSNARRAVLDWLKDWGQSQERSHREQPKWIKTLLEEVRKQTLPKRKRPRPGQIRMVRSRATHWPLLKGSRSAAQKRALTLSKSG